MIRQRRKLFLDNHRQKLFLLFSLIFLQSCEIINPEEDIPTYVQIDSIALNTDYITEGSVNSKFTDAWIYVNGSYLGTYELPCTIPVIGEGQQKISVRAGVLDNGIASTRAAYTKTGTFDTILDMEANKTHIIKPTVRYLTGTVFAQIEDYDDGSLTLEATSANTATFSITPGSDPNALEGNSGYVELDVNHSLFEFATSTPYSLPTSTPVYVEFNYKCNQEFTLGVFVSSVSGILQSPVLNVRPSTEWNKIYVNLSDGGGIFTNAFDYKIYFRSTLPAGSSSGYIYLDNLKVLY
ncbi:MAG: hypothetical protein KA444_08570 [Bacteroidia bacterium]|nr:hypothetical protein [Bacteroidia bacterium]